MSKNGNASRQLQHRDDDGLTLQQRRLLQELASQPDWRTACAVAEVDPGLCRSWMQTNEAFVAAYDRLLGPALEIARDQLETSAIKAAGMYDEALDAIRNLEREVSCPKCNHKFTLWETGPDWNARLRAGDTVLKVSRILVDTKKIDITTVTLNAEEAMAWASLQYAQQRGLPVTVSPAMIERLKQKGKSIDPPSDQVVDAEHTRLQS